MFGLYALIIRYFLLEIKNDNLRGDRNPIWSYNNKEAAQKWKAASIRNSEGQTGVLCKSINSIKSKVIGLIKTRLPEK